MEPKKHNLHIQNDEEWNQAIEWVEANKKLIRQIASPYSRFLVGDFEDLCQEAAIVAFDALKKSKKNKKQDQFVQYFRVIFKTSCINLARGIPTVHCLEDFLFPVYEKQEEKREADKKVIHQALTTIPNRQRQLCLWLLQQPIPASTSDIAREFNFTQRQACRLLKHSIKNLSNGT